MRIGLIGLGRIGAFHAQTLSDLPAVDSLVVTDAVPAAIAAVAEKVGAEPADSPEELLKSGVDGIVIAAATGAHGALIRAGVAGRRAGVLREAAVGRPRRGRRDRPVRQRLRCPGADRLPAAVRPRLRRGPAGGRVRRTRLRAHRPVHHPGPGARRRASTSRRPAALFRDCSVHDFDTVRWLTGREPVEVYSDRHPPTAPTSSPSSAISPARPP